MLRSISYSRRWDAPTSRRPVLHTAISLPCADANTLQHYRLMIPDTSITIRRAVPTAHIHVEAVRAALEDGRLDLAEFVERSGLTLKIVQHWVAGDPIEDSFEMRVWCAAVTTAVPGWSTPREASAPEEVALPAVT